MAFESKWKTFNGVAVTSVETPNQREIYVFCQELLPLIIGSPSEKPHKTTANVTNILGGSISTTVDLSECIVASYLGLAETNRSVPDIHKGERVILYNWGDTDEWFWLPMYQDDNLRKREHWRLSCADKPTKLQGKQRIPLDDDNTYYIEIETKYDGKKHVIISTADSDGEAYRYFIKIDAVENTLRIWDEVAKTNTIWNEIVIESKTPRIRMTNASKSMVDLVGPDIYIFAPNNMFIDVGKNLAITAGESITTTTPKIVTTGTNLIKTTTNNMVTEAMNFTLTGKASTIVMEESMAFTTKAWTVAAASMVHTSSIFNVIGTIQSNMTVIAPAFLPRLPSIV